MDINNSMINRMTSNINIDNFEEIFNNYIEQSINDVITNNYNYLSTSPQINISGF